MLGRLLMSVDQCRLAYLKLSERIFTPRRKSFNFVGQANDFLQANGKFDYELLEAGIKEVIVEDCKLVEETLLQETDSRCKV